LNNKSSLPVAMAVELTTRRFSRRLAEKRSREEEDSRSLQALSPPKLSRKRRLSHQPSFFEGEEPLKPRHATQATQKGSLIQDDEEEVLANLPPPSSAVKPIQTGCSPATSSSFVPGPKPEEIRRDLCMARTWGNGFGAQCGRRRGIGDLCTSHEAQHLSHGRVDGPVPEKKLLEMKKFVLGGRALSSGNSSIRTRETTQGITWTDISWLSDGEEEDWKPQAFKRRQILGRRRRCIHQSARLDVPGQYVEVRTGDIVHFLQPLPGKRGGIPGIAEVCELFEDSQGAKLVLLRRMLTSHDLRQQMSATPFNAFGNDAIHEYELIETEECLELPLSAVQSGPMHVLSEEAYCQWADDDSLDTTSGKGGTYLCRRSVAKSGLLYNERWDSSSRERRRKELIAAFRQSTLEPSSQEDTPASTANQSVPRVPASSNRWQVTLTKASLALQPGAAAGMLPGRETEQDEVTAFLRDAVRAGGRKEVLYISGMPGTGKTASVLEAVRRLQQVKTRTTQFVPSFEFAHVNAMCLSSPGAVFAEICRKIPSAASLRRRRGVSDSNENQAQAALSRFFSNDSSSRQVVVLLLDEVDALVTQAQSVLYRLFDWLTRPGARLAVVAISNTMDLPERLLPRVTSRLGVIRVNFAPYSRAQLKTILADRLRAGQAEGAFTDDALMLCAARVAGASGDARKALQVCRRAIEQALTNEEEPSGPITITQLAAAEADLLRGNPTAQAIRGLGGRARLLLLAIVLELQRRQAASALPLRVVLRRYEGLLKLKEQRGEDVEPEVEQATTCPESNLAVPHLRQTDEAHFLVRRLQAMSMITPPKRCKLDGHQAAEDEGDECEFSVQLGESLDVDDVADSLASIDGDDMAKELLGLAQPPVPHSRAD
jgi:Cdc6-like AAA superfamily ATPase